VNLMNLTAALYEHLATDVDLVALLATYQDEPAIFTSDPAPEDADFPFIVTAGQISDIGADTKTTRGRDLQRDIRCYDQVTGSPKVIEEIAELVRDLMHDRSFVMDKNLVVQSEVSFGPVAFDETDAYGRIVTVRLLIEEVP